VLKALLERAGINVAGRAAAGGAGVRFELARVQSRPLAQIIHALGKQSDNFCAEMLLKALGRTSTAPGSSSSGAAVIEAYLNARGASVAGTRIVNGSGLYDASRVSAFTLTRVLGLAHQDARIGPELVSALAIGGVDGTLSSRFRAQSTLRNVRAKTGTLANVIALSGYLFGPRPAAFAILVNNLKQTQISEARRRIDAALAPLLT
jgi:D-alanyl-D-alanine carboxypeptidase/D-alanyl-D-alanine-endopeptidase (penicillin-binding protein 4)